ncbi:MAG: hypothetical protein HDT42_13475 [Ruminococcaceae bacterium]|nr:hypothetical protein [Oscillospiraceae bacterium]
MMSNNEINLEIGEPIPSEFDYSLSPAELDRCLSEQMELFKQGKRSVPTHEFSMLGYALDFIDFAKNRCNQEIDFDERCLPVFLGILNALRKMFAENPPPDEFFKTTVKQATGYFGIVIIKNIGGQWVNTNMGMGIAYKGENALIMNPIGRFLQTGDDTIMAVYEHLKKV